MSQHLFHQSQARNKRDGERSDVRVNRGTWLETEREGGGEGQRERSGDREEEMLNGR